MCTYSYTWVVWKFYQSFNVSIIHAIFISSVKCAPQPSVTDLEVGFDVTSGFDALEAPDKLPTIFSGDKTSIYGIFRSKAASDQPLEASVSRTAMLKGKVLWASFEHTIPFEIPIPSDSPYSDSFQMPIVHHLAAKSHPWLGARGRMGFNCSWKRV